MCLQTLNTKNGSSSQRSPDAFRTDSLEITRKFSNVDAVFPPSQNHCSRSQSYNHNSLLSHQTQNRGKDKKIVRCVRQGNHDTGKTHDFSSVSARFMHDSDQGPTPDCLNLHPDRLLHPVSVSVLHKKEFLNKEEPDSWKKIFCLLRCLLCRTEMTPDFEMTRVS